MKLNSILEQIKANQYSKADTLIECAHVQIRLTLIIKKTNNISRSSTSIAIKEQTYTFHPPKLLI